MAIKKYSKVKFTLRKELIIILASIVVLLVATLLLNLPTEEEKFITKWQEAGAQITENHLYEEISYDGLKNLLDGKQATETTYVFFATPSSDAATYFTTIISLADACDVSKVYIVDSAFIADLSEDQLETKANYFKDEAGEAISLESNLNFWTFKGNVVVESVDKYELADDKWNVCFAHSFAEAYPAKPEQELQ